jgi:hypothetical protein
MGHLPAGLQPPCAAHLGPGRHGRSGSGRVTGGVSPSTTTSKPGRAPCSASQARRARASSGLIAAVVVGVGGVLGNGGTGHALTPGFALFGYHVTGSTGTLFLYGIVVGAIAVFGLSVPLAGARRTSRRGRTARRGLKESRREAASVSRDRDDMTDQRDTARAETASALGDGAPSGDQPVGSGDQSVGSGNQPVGSGNQSVGSGNQPVGSGNQSVGSGNQPVGSGNQSVGSEDGHRSRWQRFGRRPAPQVADTDSARTGRPGRPRPGRPRPGRSRCASFRRMSHTGQSGA